MYAPEMNSPNPFKLRSFALGILMMGISAAPGCAGLTRKQPAEEKTAIMKDLSQIEQSANLSEQDYKILTSALKDKDWHVRDKAVKVMARSDSSIKPYLPEIISMFADPVPNVWLTTWQTLRTLGRKYPQFTDIYILHGRNSSNTQVKSGLLRTIGWVGNASNSGEQWIVEELHHPDSKVRGAAVAALGAAVADAAAYVDKIEPLLNDDDPFTIAEALHAFARIGPASFKKMTMIEKLLDSPHDQVRAAAMQAIVKIGKPSGGARMQIVSTMTDSRFKDTGARTRANIAAVKLIETWDIQTVNLLASACEALNRELDSALESHEKRQLLARYLGVEDETVQLRVVLVRLIAKRFSDTIEGKTTLQKASQDPSQVVAAIARDSLSSAKQLP